MGCLSPKLEIETPFRSLHASYDRPGKGLSHTPFAAKAVLRTRYTILQRIFSFLDLRPEKPGGYGLICKALFAPATTESLKLVTIWGDTEATPPSIRREAHKHKHFFEIIRFLSSVGGTVQRFQSVFVEELELIAPIAATCQPGILRSLEFGDVRSTVEEHLIDGILGRTRRLISLDIREVGGSLVLDNLTWQEVLTELHIDQSRGREPLRLQLFQDIAKLQSLVDLCILCDLDGPDRRMKVDCLQKLSGTLQRFTFDGWERAFREGMVPVLKGVGRHLSVLGIHQLDFSTAVSIEALGSVCSAVGELHFIELFRDQGREEDTRTLCLKRLEKWGRVANVGMWRDTLGRKIPLDADTVD
ncbi:hypothetical protein M427DRAFT_146403 [Gonapodya prolifera JEL478]|uniref:Uncharacterized protein n=1 Tax=Gonapodya prolifera (strain JEL478) TaxID=1344416 RepID=A0A139AAQ5_GONPJ|nr:hypothetical protein M427DRAFT_146403 [Gonapodya prolifera JEL478]|eukprot:KXS13754.1 hypothetical protein M427DRAFT_146403 [Gonapodya prolifera JEL478]